jgi:hypothetical protein
MFPGFPVIPLSRPNFWSVPFSNGGTTPVAPRQFGIRLR